MGKKAKRNKAAEAAQAAAAQAAAEAQLAANNLQANLAKDLKTENVSQVVAGGTADAMDAMADSTLKKKRPQGSLSSQLGVNV